MKIVIRTYRWIILSIIIQLIILSYFDYYFNADKKVDFESKQIYSSDKIDTQDGKIDIAPSATDLKLSYDSSYVGYFLNSKLEIMNLISQKTVKAIQQEGSNINFFRWLPDRNIIIYAVKFKVNKQSYVQIFTYDVENGIEKKYPKIASGSSYDAEIQDIDLSPLTNVVYTKVKISDSKVNIYRFNIMEQMNYIMNADINTVIDETNYSDNLIYQDYRNKIFVRENAKGNTKTLDFDGKVVLLGVDSEDKVYVGELDSGGKVFKIYHGKIADATKKWDYIQMKKNVVPKNIFISQDGMIYERIEVDNSIFNIKENKSINYKGDFIDLFNNHMLIRYKDHLTITKIK